VCLTLSPVYCCHFLIMFSLLSLIIFLHLARAQARTYTVNHRLQYVIHSFIRQWLYILLLGPSLFFSFVIFFYTDDWTSWTSDQPIARPLPTHKTTQTQNRRTHSGIRTHDPSVLGSEDNSCHRPRGHCDRPFCYT
jgi:hypothetical protein